jgi:hypothetical protein
VIPTTLVLIRGAVSVNERDRRLRTGSPSIITRIVDDCTAIDLRTVAALDDALLPGALAAADRA